MVPLVERETAFRQKVSESGFWINIFVLDLWVQVDSVEQPMKRNSVGSETRVSLLEIRPLIIILMTASLSSKIYN